MTRFEVGFTARAEDIDENGHVNNAVWVRWLQEVAGAHWRAAADPAHVAAYLWLVTRHEIDYLRGLREGERVTARTWLADGPRGARFDRHVEFVGARGEAYVRAVTTWAMVDRETGRAMRVPRDVIARFVA